MRRSGSLLGAAVLAAMSAYSWLILVLSVARGWGYTFKFWIAIALLALFAIATGRLAIELWRAFVMLRRPPAQG